MARRPPRGQPPAWSAELALAAAVSLHLGLCALVASRRHGAGRAEHGLAVFLLAWPPLAPLLGERVALLAWGGSMYLAYFLALTLWLRAEARRPPTVQRSLTRAS